MGRILVLISLILLTLGSFSGYVVLNKLILTGSLKIAAGEKQIAEGQMRLAKGKERLASGEQELSHGKKVYGGLNNKGPMLLAAVVMPATLVVSALAGSVANKKIAEGDKMVAEGKAKVRAGQEKLEAGKQELNQGIERLNHAKLIRTLCGCGTLFFTTIFIGLCFFWRRYLFKLPVFKIHEKK